MMKSQAIIDFSSSETGYNPTLEYAKFYVDVVDELEKRFNFVLKSKEELVSAAHIMLDLARIEKVPDQPNVEMHRLRREYDGDEHEESPDSKKQRRDDGP